MLQKFTGIVLWNTRYNDTSNVACVYTLEQGMLSFFVRMPQGRKAKLKNVLFQPMSVLGLDVDVRSARSLNYVREAQFNYTFQSIPYNPYKAAIAMFLAEFLHNVLQNEGANEALFDYLFTSIRWLDEAERDFANFHLAFLMRLTRFLGIYPNLQGFRRGAYFDLLSAEYVSVEPIHSSFLYPAEAETLVTLFRMNYRNMRLFRLNRSQRIRFLEVLYDFYRMHIAEFRDLKSMPVLQELFD